MCLFTGGQLKTKKDSYFYSPPPKKIPGDVFPFFFLKDKFNDAVHYLNNVMFIIKSIFLLPY